MNGMKKKWLGASLTALVVASLNFSGGVEAADTSDDQVYTLNPVVVTATRTPVKLNKAPANISVVTGKEIAEKHYTDMSQVLRDVSNVYIGNYGTGIGYENSNSMYINGSNSVVYMVDGVIMNTAGVNPPMVSLRNMNNIDRIEVLKGAASALYGSSAVGGVINIITKKPEEGTTTTLRAMGGSYDQEQYMVSNEGKENGFSWRATYQKDLMGDYKDAHGTKIPQHLNGETTSVMLGEDFDENNSLNFYYDRYDSDVMYSNTNKSLDVRRKGKIRWDNWRGVYTSKIGDRVTNRFTFMRSHYDTNYNAYRTNVWTKDFADQVTWTTDKNTLTGGFDWRQDKVLSQNNVKLTNMSYYLQDEWKFAPGWTLTPGVRIDHHSAFGSHTSAHASLGYDVDKNTNVYVSYNQYFIAPTPSQLYSSYGDPGLKPETGHAWEIGMSHQFSDTMVGSIHFFTRKSTDKIGYSYATYKYANFDTEKAHGFSADLKKYFSSRLSARVGYTYTHVDSTPQRAANVDGYVPKHAVTAGIDYDAPKWDAHLDVRGNIDRPGPQTSDVEGRFFPKNTYWITDISANYRPTKNITIFGRINNLFDVFYAEASNARSTWWGEPDEWWTAPGRNYQVGVEFKF